MKDRNDLRYPQEGIISVIKTKRNKSNENLELRKKKPDSYKSRTVDNPLALLVGKETHAITAGSDMKAAYLVNPGVELW